MNTTLLANVIQQPWFLIAAEVVVGVLGVIGLVALCSPALFAKLARAGATWFDTRPFFQRIDRPVYVDSPLMLHSRVFGVIVLAGAGALVWFMPSTAPWTHVVGGIAAVLGAIGAIAFVWPKCFRQLAEWGNTWIDTSPVLNAFDHRIDIDDFVLRHSRVFGIFVLASIAVMVALWFWRQ